ncbi:MAG: hypothetical protein ACXABG_01305 [Promethearchaeota archaeon]
MHVIVLFGILSFILFRVIGLIISIEFYRELKDSKFKILIIGWLSWIIAGLSAILVGIFENQLLGEVSRLINGISTSIAILFVLMGLYSYFQAISRRTIAFFITISIILPFFTFFMRINSISVDFTSGLIFIFVFVYSFLPLKKKEVFKKELSIKSFYWYLAFIFTIYVFIIFYVIILLQGYSFGFYSDEYSIQMFLNYFIGVINSIIILIYSIHIEYDISRVQKYKLRDKYSHDLGNLIQVIYSATDLTNVDDDLSKEKAENLDIIKNKCEEAAKLIKDIKNLK